MDLLCLIMQPWNQKHFHLRNQLITLTTVDCIGLELFASWSIFPFLSKLCSAGCDQFYMEASSLTFVLRSYCPNVMLHLHSNSFSWLYLLTWQSIIFPFLDIGRLKTLRIWRKFAKLRCEKGSFNFNFYLSQNRWPPDGQICLLIAHCSV